MWCLELECALCCNCGAKKTVKFKSLVIRSSCYTLCVVFLEHCLRLLVSPFLFCLVCIANYYKEIMLVLFSQMFDCIFDYIFVL